MPCRDDGPCEPSERSSELKTRCDLVTKLLCEVLTRLEDGEVFDGLDEVSNETREWWAEHKRADRERKLALARVARKKLSADEFEAIMQYGHST